MTKKIKFSPEEVFGAAHEIAREQEKQARLFLWERVSEKATFDSDFRQLIARDPEQAIEQEARILKDDSGKQIQVEHGVVKDVVEKARATYSSVVPEVAMEAVEKLIFGTIQDIRRSFNLALVLSQVLFYAGLTMTCVAFTTAIIGVGKTASLLFGAGGVGSVLISSLVMSPLNRIQDAAADLIQLQMAYLSYYKQLYILGGKTHNLSTKDAVKFAKEIDRATVSLMSSVHKYVEKDQPAELVNSSQKVEDKPK